ncbi:YesL family protein [Mesobacillus maritimus]|uniref:YesL family protein n=1 Tax=Mesobacillus maritimus TaxID=1643336 RepID=A0ABS7K136_9BACI|nr:YesL family protein [Mesobacillus maritimus]MBY0095968.1 YesL family protein [Mesobacillus maritimus]
MNRFSINGLFAVTEWITKFAYINLLWLGFSIAGLGIFGFFPSTISMFTVIRKWLIGETDVPVFSTFWKTFKKEFRKSNILGMIILVVTGLLFLDLVFMKNNGSSFTSIIHIPLYLFIFTCVMTLLYLFPVYVHYDVKFFEMIKNSFLIMLINPLSNLVMISGIVAVYFIVITIPGIGFFFGGSITSMIIMATCYAAFTKIEQKKQITETT